MEQATELENHRDRSGEAPRRRQLRRLEVRWRRRIASASPRRCSSTCSPSCRAAATSTTRSSSPPTPRSAGTRAGSATRCWSSPRTTATRRRRSRVSRRRRAPEPIASRCCPPTARCSISRSSTRTSGARPRAALIVPDRHGTGTNALVLSPPDAFAPAFGPDSCARHVSRARAAGISFALERIESLAIDLDTPEDMRGPARPAAAGPRAGPADRQGPLGAGRPARAGGRLSRALGSSRAADPAARGAAGDARGRRPRAPGRRGGPSLATTRSWSSPRRSSRRRRGRLRRLAEVEPSERARELAERAGQGPGAGRAGARGEPRGDSRRAGRADHRDAPGLGLRERGDRRLQPRARAG